MRIEDKREGSGALTGRRGGRYPFQPAHLAAKLFRIEDLSDDGVCSGATTNTLHISDSTGLNGTFYRCIVICADGGKIASDYFFLQVL